MKLFNLFRRGSAPIARERLQILLAHERNAINQPDLLGILREAILRLISRHVSFDPDKVQNKMDRGKSVSTLAVDIEIPNLLGASGVASLTGRPAPSRRRNKGMSGMDQRVA